VQKRSLGCGDGQVKYVYKFFVTLHRMTTFYLLHRTITSMIDASKRRYFASDTTTTTDLLNNCLQLLTAACA